MDLTTLAAIVIVICLFYWRTIFNTALERWHVIRCLHCIPGPFALPIVGTAWQFKWNMKELTFQFREWGFHHASLGHSMIKFWIGPRPFVMIIRPEATKEVLESQSLLTKGPEYDILMPWLGTGLLISTGDKWRNRRKLLTPSFHFKMLNSFVNVHNEESRILVEQLEKHAEIEEKFDIFPFIKRCALDIICETAMGCSVSAQTNHNHPYVFSVQRMNELSFQYLRMPWLQIKPIWYLSGVGYEYDHHLDTVTKFTKQVILDRLNDGCGSEEKSKVFLDTLVDLHREGVMNYEDIREEVDTFMFEGHDTTSASMGWTIWCLATHPEKQQLVIKELDAVFGDTNRDCTVEDLTNLKYLEKCIKESLRQRPSVPMLSRRCYEDLHVDGMIIPKGCSVAIATAMIHMNESIYDNPDEYRPERFNEENIAKRHPYSYIPFSAGPRNCIGQKFALMEEKIVLSWFFRRYRVTTDIPFLDNIPLPEIIIRPSMGFPVSIHKR